jgi:hypothetical protein
MRRARESATLGSKRPTPSPVMPAQPSTPLAYCPIGALLAKIEGD